jgi:hypothetical protein
MMEEGKQRHCILTMITTKQNCKGFVLCTEFLATTNDDELNRIERN